MAHGADGGSKKNSLSGFGGQSQSMENVVFFEGNMLEALGKQNHGGSSVPGSAKNHTRSFSRESTAGKLPTIDHQGKPPPAPFVVVKQSSGETTNPFQNPPKKAIIGGSLTDVYKEANDIIEEFKREEENAGA